MRRLLLILAALAAAPTGCGAEGSAGNEWRLHEDPRSGLAVTLPDSWHVADENLTPYLLDPRERLSVASFPLRAGRNPCAKLPGGALAGMGPEDAFVSLQERGEGTVVEGFPRRARPLRPEWQGHSDLSACTPGPHPFREAWTPFSDGGRFFYLIVALGKEASAETRERLQAVLDSLRVDPAVRPHWAASP